ncbi:MAG: restriction endonuclease subunit S [Nanoarchaeota archaeon]
MITQTKFKQTEIGKIPEDWEIVKLADKIIHRKGFAFKSSEFQDAGHPIIRVSNFTDKSIDLNNCNRLDFNKLSNYNEVKLKSEDVVIATVGSWPSNPKSIVGKVIKIPAEGDGALLNQNAVILRPVNSTLDNSFLFYRLRNQDFSDYLISGAQGSANQASITLSSIFRFEFCLPSIKEQQAIAKILSDLDSKIELNQKMNKTLEAIGQALFKKWFIDERKENWKDVKLGDFIVVERGLSYKGSGLNTTGIPMINLGNIAPNNHFRYDGLKFYSGNYRERNLVQPGDLIIANTDITQKREILGSCLIVPSDLGNDKIIFTHHIYVIRFINKDKILPKHFLSYLLQTKEFRERATGFATGTTVLALPEDAILNFKFAMPDKEKLTEFDRIINYIKNKSSINIIETRNLSQIRDSLLPKLMSGEIRVKL